MKRLTLTMLALLGAASTAWTATADSNAAAPAYEQVERFHFFGRLDNWRAVDRDTLIVWTTPARPYLVELVRPSPDLRFAEAIGVTSTIGRVHARLDAVRVRGWDYPIEAIYRLSREQAARELGWDEAG